MMRTSFGFCSCSISTVLTSLLLLTVVYGQALPKLNDATTAGATATATEKNSPTTTTNTGTTNTSGQTADPTNSAAAATSDAPALTGFPKLAGQNYPPPTVPPTANAPFMQKSNLPEGTVFICVGAALGFLGFLVLAWRGLVAWSIHRSVKRAAIAQSSKYARAGGGRISSGGKKSPYFNSGFGSTMSLDQLGAGGKNIGSRNPSAHNSLFFSPTAGTQMHTQSNRGSEYLPAGYYASGNSAPGAGTGMTHIGGGSAPLSNLGNQNRGNSRSRPVEPSIANSPGRPTSRRDSAFALRASEQPRLSTHSMGVPAGSGSPNLSVAPQGRAPSAYLEDLFENHAPGSLPSEEPRGKTRR